MKLTTFYQKLTSLPEDIKKATARAMFYAGFAMQSTEKQVFASTKDNAAMTQMMGAHTTLGQLLGGVVSEQTKIMEAKYTRILDELPYYHVDLEMVMDADGEYRFRASSDLTKRHTKESYDDKLMKQWVSRTDKSDNYPIDFGLLINRVWQNVEECTVSPDTEKVFSSNFYLSALNPAETQDCNLDEVTEVVHVKSLGGDDRLKLLEFYTPLNRTVMPYYFYQSEGVADYLNGIQFVTLIKKSHREDEIFLYRIKEFKAVKEHNGKLLIKAIATNELEAAK